MINLQTVERIGDLLARDITPDVTARRLGIDLDSLEELRDPLESVVEHSPAIGVYVTGLMTGLEIARIETEKKLHTKYEDYWNNDS